jgi:hypothetical protein
MLKYNIIEVQLLSTHLLSYAGEEFFSGTSKSVFFQMFKYDYNNHKLITIKVIHVRYEFPTATTSVTNFRL